MRTDFVISVFGGNVKSLATALGISDKAVYQWGETVPELRQFQLALLRPDVFIMPPVGKKPLTTK